MRSYLLFFPALFFSLFLQAQTFNGSGGAIPGTSTSRTCFNINVTGVGIINTTTGLAQVCMNITHPNVDELEIVLVAPDGTTVPLTIQNGGSGNNYTGTCFSATAGTSIKAGVAPFTGSFIPEGYLGAVNNGQNANGNWSLCIQDRRTAANAGSLVNWSITFSNSPAPLPPPIPACTTTIPGTSSCSNATSVCDFSGVCGNTSGTTVQDWAGSGLNACFGLENNSFVKFVASSATASFSVWVPTTTTGGYNTAGIQMLFFSGTCNSGPVTTYGCYPHIYPYPSAGNPLITIVNGTGFTPGNTYYLMIDGFNGDKCTYTIEANSGVNILDISPAAPSICAGSSVNLTASGGSGTYTWAPPTGLNTTSGATVTASPAGTITYTVTSTTFGVCPVTKDVTVTVNPVPAAPVLTVVNNCGNSTITATGVTGTLTWSDGGSGNPRTVTIPGPYTVTQTTTGCTSLASNAVTAAPLPVPAAPVLSVVNNCGNSTITATGVTGTLTWSDGGSGNPRTVTTAGTYTVTQTVGGCPSPASNAVTTAPLPVPAAPVLTVVNNCGNSTITATGVTGTLTWSDAGTGNPRTVTTAGTYTVTQTVGGCTSISSNAVTTAPLPVPAAPVLTVVDNCGNSTITATGVTGTLTWSDGGSGNPRTVTIPGPYTVTQTTGGCTSLASNTVNAAPLPVPAAPVLTVTNNCGSSTITATGVTGTLTWSDGGSGNPRTVTTAGTYTVTQSLGGCSSAGSNAVTTAPLPVPAAPVLSVVNNCGNTVITATGVSGTLTWSDAGTGNPRTVTTAGTYTVTQSVGGCTSIISNAVTTAPVPIPATPTATVPAQPTCITPTATILVTAPTGPGLEYSINGTAYQASTTFNNVVPNSYSITVKNSVTGCVSLAGSVTVNPVPAAPAAPVIAVVQPDCNSATGSITITSPTGANLQYSINGTTYQASATFNNIVPNTYTVTVQNILSGCISTASAVTILAATAIPPVTASVSMQPNCTTSTGTIVITAPTGSNIEYSVNGGPFQPGTTYSGLTPGNYSIVTRFTGSACASVATNLVVVPVDLNLCRLDIYFPSAFTPNGDGNNDGFGPGPLSNLTGISGYTLHIYNRYGQLVFLSHDPYKRWSGAFKGRLSGNTTYAWQASYTRRNGVKEFQKGSVTIIR